MLERPGARLVYEVAGTGPAVVLVHGFGLDRRMWDPQAEHLAARFRVVRYDCRGFGASGPFDPAVPYTHAGDLVALLDHLALGRAVLVGLSFGGRVVLETALAGPDRVRGLVLLDAVLGGVPWDRESEAGMDEVARQVRAGGVPGGRAAWLAHPLFAAARQRPDLASSLADMVAGYPGQHWLGLDPHQQVRPDPSTRWSGWPRRPWWPSATGTCRASARCPPCWPAAFPVPPTTWSPARAHGQHGTASSRRRAADQVPGRAPAFRRRTGEPDRRN